MPRRPNSSRASAPNWRLLPAGRAAFERSRWIAAMVLVALVPASAALLYAFLGNPLAVSAPAPATQLHRTRRSPRGGGDHRSADHRDGRPARGENEGESRGRQRLGAAGTLLSQARPTTTTRWRRSRRPGSTCPKMRDLLTDQAEALAFAQGQRLAGRPAELLNRALVLEPDYPKALAIVAAGRGRAQRFRWSDQALPSG